jgi:hypothetical protein
MKVFHVISLCSLAALASACNDNSLTALPIAPVPAEPPVAVISASTSSFSPLDTALFDGSASHDSDGVIVDHAWTITMRPSGSNSSIQTPGDDGANAEFFVDFAGDYVIELTVTDDTGLTGSTTFAFSAVPWQTVHVELAWDVDQSDVDLHLLDQGGTYADAPGDCYYSNKTPDWGDPGPANDPTLDIDDVDGYGPENINIAEPRDGSTYRVLVHYYDDDGMGATNATIRIYLNGTLQYESVKVLSATDKVWDVATISWPTGEITEIGTITDEAAAN